MRTNVVTAKETARNDHNPQNTNKETDIRSGKTNARSAAERACARTSQRIRSKCKKCGGGNIYRSSVCNNDARSVGRDKGGPGWRG
jgi:hypothetical protein